jgi:hypothetical protein
VPNFNIPITPGMYLTTLQCRPRNWLDSPRSVVFQVRYLVVTHPRLIVRVHLIVRVLMCACVCVCARACFLSSALLARPDGVDPAGFPEPILDAFNVALAKQLIALFPSQV